MRCSVPWRVGVVWLLGVFVCLWMTGCQAVGDPQTLRVTTFNIRVATKTDGENHWDFRKNFVTRLIRDLSPDILATQEGNVGQIEYIEKKLWGYTRVGVGRNDGQKTGEYTPLFVRDSRLKIMDSGTFWLSETPETPGSMGWDAAYPRVVTWIHARDKAMNRTLMIVNTHWDNKGRRARLASARMVHTWLEKNAPNEPVILLGDLNSREDTAQVKLLLDANEPHRLYDAYREVHPVRMPDESTLSKYKGQILGSRIDFICHTDDFTAESATIVRTSKDGKFPSDHYPVTSVLRWKIPEQKTETAVPSFNE